MATELSWERDSYYCARKIEEGLDKNSVEDIEKGLSLAYELFVNYVLEDRCQNLLTLGRDLNAAYFPYRSEVRAPDTLIISYQGQIRSLINLCDYVSQRLVPERAWQVVSKSKYAKPILQILMKNGAMLATELCAGSGLTHKTQLARTVLPLIDEGLVRQEKFGKNVWYSLTSTGRLMAAKHFRTEETSALESILPAVITRMGRGWQSLNDLIDNIRVNVPISTLRSLVISVLSALQEAGIVEEREGNWRIIPRLSMDGKRSMDISAHPDLMAAAAIIEKEYEQLKLSGMADKDHIAKARSILEKAESAVAASSTDQHAIHVRIALERGKCAALEGNWNAAIDLMREGETTARLQGIDTKILERELERVWSYVQQASVEPLVAYAKNYVARKDYDSAKDILLSIFNIYAQAGRPLTNVTLSKEILGVTIHLSKLAGDLKRELDQVLEQEFELRIPKTDIEWLFPMRGELEEHGRIIYSPADDYAGRI